MKFIDETTIKVIAGKGGDGMCAFRREKYVPRGGPDGGDGGDGGDVILIANNAINSLLKLQYNSVWRAEDGVRGKSKNMHGRKGKNCEVFVPCGTLIFDSQTNELITELLNNEESYVIAKGGRKGLGNTRFVSSTHQVPTKTTLGKDGEEKSIRLELKLMADVGLVGLPNAGKSTFISAVSSAKPKIADYPFTTLSPVLGVVRTGDYKDFVVADIPGLIEFASQGAGLGIEFLKHIERTRILLHLVDLSYYPETDPIQSFEVICNELFTYNADFKKKKMIIVLTKTDTISDPETLENIKKSFIPYQMPIFSISSVARSGLDELLYNVQQLVEAEQLAYAMSQPIF